MKPITIVCAALLLAASTFAAEPSAEIKEKIREINSKMAKAALEGKSAENLEHYAEDAISMPNYSPMLKGKAAIREHWKQMEEGGFKFNEFDSEIMALKEAGDVIHEIGTYSVSMTIPGMPEPVSDKGKYVTIWKKQPNGSVKIVLEIYNTDAYPAMPQ